MEHYLCEDVLGIIYGQLPYDLKNIFIVNKYCYRAFLNFKKTMCIGNYYLTPIQHKLVNTMLHHLDTNHTQSLVIQSNISTGKTCACLTFALNKYEGTVVIMVPLSVMPQWHSEIIKMYGNTMNDRIIILHNNYIPEKLIKICKNHDYDPASIRYKVVIVSNRIRTHTNNIVKHSVVLMDEVHTKWWPDVNPRFIGVTASKAIMWTTHEKCNYVVYEEEEELPSILEHNVICGNNITDHIEDIMVRNQGPYLIIGNKNQACYIPTKYIDYDRTPQVLAQMNNMQPHECAFLDPGHKCTGINLTRIQCVIFIFPTTHINATVIQAIGRVRRVTSKNKEISLYHLHQKKNDIYLYKTYLSENEVNQFASQHELKLLKHERSKFYMDKVICALLKYTTYEKLDTIDNIYYALLVRVARTSMDYLINFFGDQLNIKKATVKYCFR